jgi:hypothetical protein
MTRDDPSAGSMTLSPVAPSGAVTPYDQRHLALYAALLDAHSAGLSWRKVATEMLLLDPESQGTMECWQSHLNRALWIVSDGLAEACSAFGANDGAS